MRVAIVLVMFCYLKTLFFNKIGVDFFLGKVDVVYGVREF